jgi:D-amino peptidase
MRHLLLLASVAVSPLTLVAQARPIRVLVYHDMEGLAGQDDPFSYRFDHPQQYAKGRQMLVADLSAVIAGLFDGGATEVNVIDAHGSGNPEPDVPEGSLDPRVKQVFRDKPFRGYVDLVEPDRYDAVAAVAMHSKTGSHGFAAHTITIGMALELNGKEITETELVGYSWGRVNVPLIFVSGDDRLREDLEALPWIEFVTTKKATSSSTVELYPVDRVHAEMRAAAKRAVQNIAKAQALKTPSPVTAALRVVPPASLEAMKGFPGVRYADNKVTFEAADFGAAYDGWQAIITVARAGYSSVMNEMVAAQPNGQALRLDFSDRLFARWMDYESGRWSPPAPTSQTAGRRYHGSN